MWKGRKFKGEPRAPCEKIDTFSLRRPLCREPEQIPKINHAGRSKYFSKQFHVAQSTIGQIVTGTTWRYLLCNVQR